jgi:nitroreductase
MKGSVRADIFEIIKTRRSIRKFTKEQVPDHIIDKVIEAGTWAPSGLNNQPWRFAIIRDQSLKEKISKLTHYSRIIKEADVLIGVFLDNSSSYDRTKDVQAIGACIQNMLLYIHSLGLGAVWLGEILKNREKVLELLGGPSEYELMAIIALGHPATKGGKPGRKGLNEVVFFKK